MIRVAYFGAILKALERARELVRAIVVPHLEAMVREADRARGDGAEHLDESISSPNQLLDDVADQWFEEWPNERLAATAKVYATRTSDFQREQLAKQFRAVMGIDIYRSEPWLAPKVAAFTQENVALIKSVATDHFAGLEKRLTRNLREGDRWESLAETIEERYGVAESRAKLIARDQVGKMYGELNQTRQEQLGVVAFVWRTMKDNRVREEHAGLDGKRFTWDEPPVIDGEEVTPGSPINCRCFADPDFSSLTEEGPNLRVVDDDHEDAEDVVERDDAGEHKGTFLGFKVPVDVAEELAVPGGEPPEDMHVTLFYAKGLSAEQAEVVESSFREAWANHGTVTLSIVGVDVFPASKSSDWKRVLIGVVESDGLLELRRAWLGALAEQGIAPNSEHGFRPHVTLKYLEDAELPPAIAPAVSFDVAEHVFEPGAAARGDAGWEDVPRDEHGRWTTGGASGNGGVEGEAESAIIEHAPVSELPAGMPKTWPPPPPLVQRTRTGDAHPPPGFPAPIAAPVHTTPEEIPPEEARTIAETLHAEAKAQAEGVTNAMMWMEDEHATLVGLAHAVKGEGSLARKIATDAALDGVSYEEAAEKIGDRVRYTLKVSEETYADKVGSTLASLEESGFQVYKFKNTWGSGGPYQGVNVNLRTPNGVSMELQFHTRESFYVKESLNHPLYEERRLLSTTPARRAELDRAMIAYEAQVAVPKGAPDLRWKIGKQRVDAGWEGVPRIPAGQPGAGQWAPGGGGKSATDIIGELSLAKLAQASAMTPGVKAAATKKLKALQAQYEAQLAIEEAAAGSMQPKTASAGPSAEVVAAQKAGLSVPVDWTLTEEHGAAKAQAENAAEASHAQLVAQAKEAATPAPPSTEVASKIAELEAAKSLATTAGVKAGLSKKINILKAQLETSKAEEVKVEAVKVEQEATKAVEAAAAAQHEIAAKATGFENAAALQAAAQVAGFASPIMFAYTKMTPGQKAAVTRKLRALAAKGETSAGPVKPASFKPEQLEATREKVHLALGYDKAEEANSEIGGKFKAWRTALPPAQFEALDHYKGNGYKAMNAALRNGNIYGENAEGGIRSLTKALETAPALERDVTVWRGMRFGELATDPEKYLAGKQGIIHDQGFLSTSFHSHTSISFSGSGTQSAVLMRIAVPKGTRGAHYSSEHELILQRDAKIQITRAFKTSDGFTVLDGHYLGSKPVGLSQRGAKHDAADIPEVEGARYGWSEEDFAGGGVWIE